MVEQALLVSQGQSSLQFIPPPNGLVSADDGGKKQPTYPDPQSENRSPRPISIADINAQKDELERQRILDILKKTNWRVRGAGGASELLNVKASTLESRMKKLGIKRK